MSSLLIQYESDYKHINNSQNYKQRKIGNIDFCFFVYIIDERRAGMKM